jgi:transposase
MSLNNIVVENDSVASVIHERVDDIPLIIGLMQKLHLPEILNRHLGNHGNHQGLSNGWLATLWLAYILSESDHRKYTVQDWVESHRHTLERLIDEPGIPLRAVECNDDRLGIVLRRLSNTQAWEALETELWQSTLKVYAIEVEGIRLDSTTTYGYHTTKEDGLMQYGHSKDHRPDKPQLKLMAAAAEPSGHWLAVDVHPGQAADDPLYVPLMNRVRQMLGRSGLLYMGDSKMSALATRTDIVTHRDYYLMPLPRTGDTKDEFESWVDAVVDGKQPLQPIWNNEGLLGAGYEFVRVQQCEIDGECVKWDERVLVICSLAHAQRQEKRLEQKLAQAQEALWQLTPPPGRGRHQYRTEADLQTAVNQVLEQYAVIGLLQVRWECEEKLVIRYVGPGRPGPNRPKKTQRQVRYVITRAERDETAIARQRRRMGWQVRVTNLPAAKTGIAQCEEYYRRGWCLEHGFHLLKDKPLGIRPLYVRKDDQILGLTRLLTLGARLLTLLQTQVRRVLKEQREEMGGLYEGLPKLTTARPTAKRLLRAFVRAEITLTQIQMGEYVSWHITPLSPLLEKILGYLDLSPSLYTRLIENST